MQAYKKGHVLSIRSFFCHVLVEIRVLFMDFTHNTPLQQSRTFRALMCSLSCLIFFVAQKPPVTQGFLIIEASRSHSDTPHWVALLWAGDELDAETSTWQHTIPSRDRHSCPCNPSKRVTADPPLRPSGHSDHLSCILVQ